MNQHGGSLDSAMDTNAEETMASGADNEHPKSAAIGYEKPAEAIEEDSTSPAASLDADDGRMREGNSDFTPVASGLADESGGADIDDGQVSPGFR